MQRGLPSGLACRQTLPDHRRQGRIITRTEVVFFVVVAAIGSPGAQRTEPGSPVFEVASIKLNKNGGPVAAIRYSLAGGSKPRTSSSMRSSASRISFSRSNSTAAHRG
jgi:hypothetical protein